MSVSPVSILSICVALSTSFGIPSLAQESDPNDKKNNLVEVRVKDLTFYFSGPIYVFRYTSLPPIAETSQIAKNACSTPDFSLEQSTTRKADVLQLSPDQVSFF